jgi:Domain of unknown function (DUF4112)
MQSMARPKPIIPEVIEPDEKLPADLVALRHFAMLMDEALPIPGTNRRIGLDAGLGLIPGVGDAIAGVLSAWIVIGALRHRVPMLKVLRMVANILLDIVVGAIPLFGDVFDFLFEENVINLKLLMLHRDRRRPPRSLGEIGGVAAAIVAVILVFALLVAAALIAAVIWLLSRIGKL